MAVQAAAKSRLAEAARVVAHDFVAPREWRHLIFSQSAIANPGRYEHDRRPRSDPLVVQPSAVDGDLSRSLDRCSGHVRLLVSA